MSRIFLALAAFAVLAGLGVCAVRFDPQPDLDGEDQP